MSASVGIKVNSPTVVHEVFDDEVVIINLETGVYYSVSGLAAEIWTRIDEATAADIIGELAAKYGMPAQDVEASVQPFLDQLGTEGLIVSDPGVSGTRTQPRGEETERAMPGARPFEAPVLRKYSDMQDLLLLDPIHEVDEVGWPVRPTPADEAVPKDRA
jgi:hypothetical protein